MPSPKKRPGLGELRRLDASRIPMTDPDNPEIYYGEDLLPEQGESASEVETPIRSGTMEGDIRRAEAARPRAERTQQQVEDAASAVAERYSTSPVDVKKRIGSMTATPGLGDKYNIRGQTVHPGIEERRRGDTKPHVYIGRHEDEAEGSLNAAHEMTHAMGGGHTSTPGDVMAADKGYSDRRFEAQKVVLNQLRERGIPDKYIIPAIDQEMTNPTRSSFLGPEKKYKDWTDFEQNAADNIEKQIPSPVKRK